MHALRCPSWWLFQRRKFMKVGGGGPLLSQIAASDLYAKAASCRRQRTLDKIVTPAWELRRSSIAAAHGPTSAALWSFPKCAKHRSKPVNIS